MAIRHTYLKTRLVRIIMSFCSSPYRVCFSPKYNKESQSPLLYPFPEMEMKYPFTPAVPVDVSSRCLGFFEFTIWVRGWDTKARRPCFSGVAQSIGKTQTRLLVVIKWSSCFYCLPYYPKELSNTNCIRLLNPSHMQHVLNHLPFSCHFLATYVHLCPMCHLLAGPEA